MIIYGSVSLDELLIIWLLLNVPQAVRNPSSLLSLPYRSHYAQVLDGCDPVPEPNFRREREPCMLKNTVCCRMPMLFMCKIWPIGNVHLGGRRSKMEHPFAKGQTPETR
jgi:hypothetical protein